MSLEAQARLHVACGVKNDSNAEVELKDRLRVDHPRADASLGPNRT